MSGDAVGVLVVTGMAGSLIAGERMAEVVVTPVPVVWTAGTKEGVISNDDDSALDLNEVVVSGSGVVATKVVAGTGDDSGVAEAGEVVNTVLLVTSSTGGNVWSSSCGSELNYYTMESL